MNPSTGSTSTLTWNVSLILISVVPTFFAHIIIAFYWIFMEYYTKYGTQMHLRTICIKDKDSFDYSVKINSENNILSEDVRLKVILLSFHCHGNCDNIYCKLRNTGSNAKSKTFFPSFCLCRLMRSWIIALGIISKPRPYSSIGGKDHFYPIHAIIDRGTTSMQSTGLTKARSIDHGILWSLPIQH